MSVKLLTEHRLEFVSLKGGYTGSYESTLVKMHCVAAQFMIFVSYKRKYVHELLVNRLFKSAQEKVWLGELTVPQ